MSDSKPRIFTITATVNLDNEDLNIEIEKLREARRQILGQMQLLRDEEIKRRGPAYPNGMKIQFARMGSLRLGEVVESWLEGSEWLYRIDFEGVICRRLQREITPAPIKAKPDNAKKSSKTSKPKRPKVDISKIDVGAALAAAFAKSESK